MPAAEVVGGGDAQVVARRDARVDHRDADVPRIPVGAAVAHRAAHDRELRGRCRRRPCRSRWPTSSRGRSPTGAPAPARRPRCPRRRAAPASCSRSWSFTSASTPPTSDSANAAAVLGLLGELVEGLRAAQVDAGAGADDDAAPAAPLVSIRLSMARCRPRSSLLNQGPRAARRPSPRPGSAAATFAVTTPASNQTITVGNWGDLMPSR